MGTMTFHLPPGLPEQAALQLEHSCLAGGPDNMPWPTALQIDNETLQLTRDMDESGFLVAPWGVPGHGMLMGWSATLMDRKAAYELLVELARGKVNQVRGQAEEWRVGGLQVSDLLRNLVSQAAMTFGRAVCSGIPSEILSGAQASLELGYRAAEQLVQAYSSQVFRIRHARQEKLDTILSSRLDESVFQPEIGAMVKRTFNRVSLPLSWHTVEANEARYDWTLSDRLLDWAEQNELDVTAGPLIDFSSAHLPAWLWLWEQDVSSLVTFMCRYVEAVVRRYRARIRRWQLSAASNWAAVLALSEDELLTLTFRLGEAAKQVDPALELLIGVSQPWGEYMSLSERMYSPFVFADNLIRSGLGVAALDVEIAMGVQGRGSYCRDALDVSRMLDLYALLGVPLQVTLAYPSSNKSDPEADPDLSNGFGWYRDGMNPAVQAEWVGEFGSLTMCKPYVQAIQWAHLSDAHPHLFPHCGLIDKQGQIKPTAQRLQQLREEHLR